jgi:hypothetical protein
VALWTGGSHLVRSGAAAVAAFPSISLKFPSATPGHKTVCKLSN